MRWQGQELGVADAAALPGLEQLNGLVRSVTTPDFAGITFHEVMCKSALNHVPGASAMPFDWTVNPYRGCSHACTYCFARGTHEYLELDVTNLELNQIYHLSDIKLPEGVTLVALAGGHDHPVVAVNPPRAEEIDVPAEAPAAGEVPATAQAEPAKEGEAGADAAKGDAKGGAKPDAKGGKAEGKK